MQHNTIHYVSFILASIHTHTKAHLVLHAEAQREVPADLGDVQRLARLTHVYQSTTVVVRVEPGDATLYT